MPEQHIKALQISSQWINSIKVNEKFKESGFIGDEDKFDTPKSERCTERLVAKEQCCSKTYGFVFATLQILTNT